MCVAGDARIHTLNLSANNIGDRGAAALAEMLKVNIACHAVASMQGTPCLLRVGCMPWGALLC